MLYLVFYMGIRIVGVGVYFQTLHLLLRVIHWFGVSPFMCLKVIVHLY